MDYLDSFDKWLFLVLNGINHPVFDDLMFAISNRFIWIPLYAILAYLILRKYKGSVVYIFVAVAILITLSDQLAFHMFKEVFERLRPCHDPEIKDMVHLVNGHCGGQYGFLSSHASNSFALAWFLGPILNSEGKYWRSGLILWAIVVSYSRIYLGVHFPLDILAGCILGILIAELLLYILKMLDNRFSLQIFVP